jgi:glycosyltransferase involved in cell wall biosynthesis
MPSRGEGWGRPLLEAMAAGLPTIGTRFGGNLEFMNDETSYLVDARLVDVPADAVKEQPLYAGHRWGEPDVGQLKEHLVRIYRDRAAARAVGARAREHALEHFDRRVVAQQIAARVRDVAARKGQRS